MAVQRTKRALDEAEAKLRVVKQWNRVFDNRVDPLVKQMEKLHTVLAHDMVQAVAFLTQAISTLRRLCRDCPARRRRSGTATGAAESAAAGGQAMKASGARLSGITKELRAQWQDTKSLLEGRQEPGVRAASTWKNSLPAWTGRLQ